MKIGIITLFPEIFDALNYGVIGRAATQRIWQWQTWNPRDYTTDKHRMVDDRPYGGGPGMLMKVQPLRDAIHAAKNTLNAKVIYVSPQGRQFNQQAANEMTKREAMIFVAGRYEGIDERLLQTDIDEEWSIGDYVLTGGEFAILAMIDAIIRLLPNVLGDEASAEQDSFMNGLLDYPHYTRPEVIDSLKVPEVLLQGNHQAIDEWRLQQSLLRTGLKRPDLLAKISLEEKQQKWLNTIIAEYEERKKTHDQHN